MVSDDQAVIRCQRVAHRDVGVSRVSLIAIGTEQRKADDGSESALLCLGLPETVVIQIRRAVQIVRSVVSRQPVLSPVQRKLRPCNSVGVAADRCSEVGRILQVRLHTVISQNHIDEFSVSVRHVHRHPCAAQIGKRGRHAIIIIQRIESDRFSGRHNSPLFFPVSHFSYLRVSLICVTILPEYIPAPLKALRRAPRRRPRRGPCCGTGRQIYNRTPCPHGDVRWKHPYHFQNPRPW